MVPLNKTIVHGDLFQGYDVNQRDAENVSLLHWAAINNRLEIAGQVIVAIFVSQTFVKSRTALRYEVNHSHCC